MASSSAAQVLEQAAQESVVLRGPWASTGAAPDQGLADARLTLQFRIDEASAQGWGDAGALGILARCARRLAGPVAVAALLGCGIVFLARRRG